MYIKAFTCGVPLQRKATPLLSEIENKLMCAYFDSCFLALKATASDLNTGSRCKSLREYTVIKLVVSVCRT